MKKILILMLIFKKFVAAMLFLDMLIEIIEQFSCLATIFFRE